MNDTVTSARPQTIFLLSPAHCGGRRGQQLLSPVAGFPLAARLRESGATIGEIFQFMSGLYFRGKLTYADAFHRAAPHQAGVLVITPGHGLLPPGRRLSHGDLAEIASVPVSMDEPRYREPFERDANVLARGLDPHGIVVLLGSIATDKYVDVLERALDGRLRFPSEFVGRGDMSRGGLMLRCVRERSELTYVPLKGAIRHGSRPPRLAALR